MRRPLVSAASAVPPRASMTAGMEAPAASIAFSQVRRLICPSLTARVVRSTWSLRFFISFLPWMKSAGHGVTAAADANGAEMGAKPENRLAGENARNKEKADDQR